MNEIIDMKCKSDSLTDLKNFKSKFTCHLRGLAAMNQNVDGADFVFVELMKKKLPKKIKENIMRNNNKRFWTMEELDLALDEEIEYLQMIDEKCSTTKNWKQ